MNSSGAAKPTNWREIVEIAGVISIVAVLLLVAWELRQANRLEQANFELQLAAEYNDILAARYSDPDVAQLYPKLESPESHLITATDAARMQALAWQLGNLYWSAQLAHDRGLLHDSTLAHYQSDLRRAIEEWPGLREHFVRMYESEARFQGSRVFRPIAEIAELAGQPEGEPAD